MVERKSWAHDRVERLCTICKSTGYTKVLADNLDASTDHEDTLIVCACRYRPLSLIIRFDGRFYPWPVNLLHHYVLSVQPHTVSLPYTEQIPYLLPPSLLHTISSPVELLGRTDYALDAHGMVLWLDNESCFVPPAFLSEGKQPGSQVEAKQRLAGVRLGLPGVSPENPFSFPEMENPEDPVPSSQRQESQWGSQSVPQESVSAHTRIYAASVSEDWYTFDFCATAGRVAMFARSGKLQIWDYL